MEKKAQRNFKRPGLLAPLGVLLTMTLSTATLRASPIDGERQPEPSDPLAYCDEPADEPAALNANLSMPEANQDSFDFAKTVDGALWATGDGYCLKVTVKQ